MIGRLTGRVVAEELDGAIVVDVNGVGYEVLVPLGTVGRAGTDADGRATLWIHTHAREDALTLFGFANESDRFAFRTLIGVSNVGPKTAIAVLSALPAAELARAIAEKDLGKMTRISGIGKKTAERLVLELRGKLDVGTAEPAKRAAGASPAEPPGGNAKELLAGALTRMGYRAAEADRAIAALGDRIGADRVGAAPLAELMREALAILAK